MVSFLAYALLRVLVIGVAAGGLYLLGMRGVLLGIVAVVVGALLSYVLFSGPRRRAIQDMQRFAQAEPKAARPDADALAEDADLDLSEIADSGLPQSQQQRGAEQ